MYICALMCRLSINLVSVNINIILTLTVLAIQHNCNNLDFSEKIGLDISCESSAKQTIDMKCLLIFSEK